MTRDDIIRMAREAGISQDHAQGMTLFLERFAALVAEQEREACAKVCEELERTYSHTYAHLNCAVLIRERSKT